ncbi:glutamyl-tRNA reductase [Dehalobacter sp. DCM]|uniref:glutamyl-tRNA reductase n=1 Tax=Dehalobacter sp. DCM TaxID=2907827 RepID=UPI0030821314|nr:glutamyl-tRNA reductase [Dehalobacter sp. DCM]
MNIRMIGIDHEKASLKERELFAFTPTQSRQAMEAVVKRDGMEGAVIISTCNRTELWLSEKEGYMVDLAQVLCDLKNLEKTERENYEHLFVLRRSQEAYVHLFQTACGLKSQIWGESQILSQIKNAIEEAREANTADLYLEKLFQMAVTSAKKVKTEIKLTATDVSVATKALERIQEVVPSLVNKRCLVIGNGEMGKIVASQLALCGAEVYITLRQHNHKTYVLPKRCKGVDYEERYAEMAEMDIVVSVTSSPHYTVKAEALAEVLAPGYGTKVFCDLAVPRDIEPTVREIDNIILLDMDSLGLAKAELRNKRSLAAANAIIEEHIAKFIASFEIRNYLPLLQNISSSASEKICRNLQKDLENLDLSDQEKTAFENRLAQVAEKVVSSVLYGFRDSIDRDLWNECFTNLEKVIR